MVIINNGMDLHNDMQFYKKKFSETYTTENDIKSIVYAHENDPVGSVFGIQVASDFEDKCYGFEIDKVDAKRTFVQYVGIWKT